MDSFRFRPQVHDLEDRVTPAATPQELMFEASQIPADTFRVDSAIRTATQIRSQFSLARMSEELAEVQQRSTKTYTDFLEVYTTLSAAYAANPASVPQFTTLAPNLVQAIAQTQRNTAYSTAMLTTVNAVIVAQGGTVPTGGQLPPAPPPPPNPADTDEHDSEVQLSTSIPDLNDPNWQALGTQGLRTLDVTEGTGAEVQAGDTVRVNYIGFLTDGTVFDSSIAKNQPASFSLNQVIAGWQQGIPGMQVGGVRRLDVPSALGYGTTGSPPSIPANARLVFEVQVLGIETTPTTTSSVAPPTTDSDTGNGTLTQEQIQNLFNQQQNATSPPTVP